MPAYGKVKVDTITYDLSGTATDVSVSNIATKASPTFTGTVTVPTPSAGDDSTKAASTAFVVASFATKASPTFTGTVTVPTPTAGDNSTKAASTAFVVTSFAPKASPAFTGTATGVNLTLSGDLTVNGTTTTINTTTLQVEDKNIEIGKVSTPSDTTADGGGLTLLGATNKTWNWVNSTDAWTSSEHIHLGDNKKLYIGTGKDLEFSHNGNNSFISEVGTGSLYISAADQIFLRQQGNSNTHLKCNADGAVEVYHNNSKKLETASGGVTVTGTLAATAVTGDGSGLTNLPPGGNTVDLVADGAIAAGKPVIIKSNGKAAQVGEITQTRSSANKLNDVQVNTDSTKRYIHVLYDTANDRAVHISSSGDRLMAQCLNVNSSKEVNAKAGSNQEVHSNADHVSACWDSVNDRAVVAFRNTTNKHGYIVVGTFTSSSAMSWGTPVEFQDDVDGAFAGGAGTSEMHITHDPSADKFLLLYQVLRSSANGTFVGVARGITIASNGTVTVGSLHNITGTNQLYNFHCVSISSNFFAFSYSDGGNSHLPTLRTATLSGTNISFGSAVVASDKDTAGQGYGGSDADLAYDSVNQKLIFVHNAYLGSTAPITQARGRVASISGTSISFDAGEDNNIVSSSRRVYFIRLIYDVSTGTTWTCYISDHTQDSGYTKIMHIGQCTYNASATYKLAYAGHIRQPNNLMDACHDLDQMQGPTIIGTSGQCLIPINDDGDTDSSYVLTYDLNEAVTNLYTGHTNFVGFAEDAISDGNTGTIKTLGNVVGNQSGLSAGNTYYVENAGTLASGGGLAYAGGLALSSSTLLIQRKMN